MAISTSERPSLPLVGRSGELAAARTSLDRAAAGKGGALFLTGPAGAGKTRLVQAIREEGERRAFVVATGAAYPMEAGVPYSVFCDLLDPLVKDQSPETLAAWTRGAPEFQLICPSLVVGAPESRSGPAEDILDLRNRLLWNLPSFLDRVRRGQPLLLILEDLEWADPSSLELLHFLARRSGEHPLLIVGSFGSEAAEAHPEIGQLTRALAPRSEITVIEVAPLGPNDVRDAIGRAFDVPPEVVRSFSEALHERTGGNPLFVRSILEALIASGTLRREGGQWVGWTLGESAPPTSVRGLVLEKLASLTPPARRVVDVAAAVGARVRFDLLREASGVEASVLLAALHELQERRILQEGQDGHDVIYTFVYPLLRDVVHADLGIARSRLLHTELAGTLERMYGDEAIRHAEELAAHILQGTSGEAADGSRAATYLAAAGRKALAACGNREAVLYLQAALDRMPSGEEGGDPAPDRYDLIVDLARARQRLGAHDETERLLQQARDIAAAASDHGRVAQAERWLGLAMFWAGRLEETYGHWERASREARAAGDRGLEARIRIGKSACLHEEGRPEEAAREAEEALRIGEAENDRELQHAARRTLVLLHTWTGPPATARKHGKQALALARELGEDRALFSSHRAMAVLEGLTGHPADTRKHLDEAKRIAERLNSPLLKLELADVEIECCAGLGQWDHGIALAEESIRMARELSQRMTLPRLLVWSGLLHLDRGDLDIAHDQLTEAWQLAGPADRSSRPAPAHTAILAHIGLAALHLASGEFADAIRVGDEGMKLVDRSGYRAWAIHRLLPVMAEAALHHRDLDRARGIAARLRRESTAFGHPVGLIWADTCDALVTWLGGDVEAGARAMAAAAERLESTDTLPYAARLRRQVAGRLAELGRREEAIRELRHVHDVLSLLGAEPELDKARGQFREVGARPPPRNTVSGTGVLTPREAEVAHLVGQRKSNKAIARELRLSPRTVGTHLSNIFRKLDVGSRSQLGDLVRTGLLDEHS